MNSSMHMYAWSGPAETHLHPDQQPSQHSAELIEPCIQMCFAQDAFCKIIQLMTHDIGCCLDDLVCLFTFVNRCGFVCDTP